MKDQLIVSSKMAHDGTKLYLTCDEVRNLVVFCVEDSSLDDDENSLFSVHNLDEVKEIAMFLNEWIARKTSGTC